MTERSVQGQKLDVRYFGLLPTEVFSVECKVSGEE